MDVLLVQQPSMNYSSSQVQSASQEPDHMSWGTTGFPASHWVQPGASHAWDGYGSAVGRKSPFRKTACELGMDGEGVKASQFWSTASGCLSVLWSNPADQCGIWWVAAGGAWGWMTRGRLWWWATTRERASGWAHTWRSPATRHAPQLQT